MPGDGQLDHGARFGVPLQHIDQIAVAHDDRPFGGYAGRDAVHAFGDPAHAVGMPLAVAEGDESRRYRTLRCAVEQRRRVGQCAAIPAQGGLDVAPGAGIVEPARAIGLEGQRELIGMAVATAQLPALEGDIGAAGVSPDDAQPLCRQADARERHPRGRRGHGIRHEERTPREIRARERGRRAVALRVGHGARPARFATRTRAVV